MTRTKSAFARRSFSVGGLLTITAVAIFDLPEGLTLAPKLQRRRTADAIRFPMWHVYILLCSDSSHYVGCTSDLKDRIARHKAGQVSYTKTRLPVKLIFYATFPDKYKAFEFEKYLKSISYIAYTYIWYDN